ncbi:putative universal stress protein [Mariprofundus micogutta]|uniref:Universal stress protein n=1 Tax=Mariprofundus micogutta TaxID=1921010 RepID=A0A1L8CML4_9PROT|nr:universal stress protein [Mariprofundus micogutta]GAV20144.1 putative universal stress protein [Mariprofundus micogutta]
MIRHNKILVPYDFSEQATEAVRRAAVLAGKFDAELHLLHVLEPSVYFETDMVSIPPIDEVNHAAHDGAVHRMQALSEQFDFDVETHVEESAGDPSRFICDFAASLPADLIVIGRHDEKGVIEHMLTGSTAERVVAHAPCSVLVTMPHDLLEDKRE